MKKAKYTQEHFVISKMKNAIMFFVIAVSSAALSAPSVGYQAATNIATHVTTTIVDRAYVDGLGVSSSPDRITNATSFITADGKWAQRANASASRWTTNDILRSDWRDFTNMSEFAQSIRLNVYPTRTVNPNWTQKDDLGRTYGGEIGKLIEYYENQTYYKWGVDYAAKAAHTKEADVANGSFALKTSGGYGPFPWSLSFDGNVFSDCNGRLIAKKNDPITHALVEVKTNAWVSDIYDIAMTSNKTEQILASRKINGQSLSGDITITTMDYQELTNTVNAVKAQLYDQPLQVNWTMRMVNGEMKLYATTNVNQSVL